MDDLRERLRALPCGRRLLDAAAGMHGVHLVGGAVRDLLLGREPRELDVVVEGDVGALAARLGGDAERLVHERFGTATVRSGGCRWDLAASRGERYAHPGALPDVFAAGIDEDLRRRDVTVNAIALDLSTGELRAAAHAEQDVRDRRLRVLHDASFAEDPTRLWRIARYAARLGFELEEFGGDTLRVSAYPALLRREECDGAVRALAEDLEGLDRGSRVEEAIRRIAATMACHAAVKANYPLTPEKMAHILDELRLKPPQTWQELKDMIWVLQQNGMDFYYPPVGQGRQGVAESSAPGFTPFLFQHGGDYYTADGRGSALDSPAALAAFDEWTGLYTNYKIALSADFFNRM
ncbi:MAG: hypothetical protein KY433_11410, partial [Actinobacteria bacterium]|nr:hypothetical protein [Actinomycetota bacterium]